MRWERTLWGLLAGLLVPASAALAQNAIDCGSTGVHGALTVPAGETVTLDVPDDGIFNYTTVTVNGTLEFNRNERFNPPVYLLSQGDISVSQNGRILVNGTIGDSRNGGRGGPGGFDGGAPGIAGGNPGAGHGPGAGGPGGGFAAYGSTSPMNTPADGVVYGSPLLVPIVGGSGGGGDTSNGGGGGGGAVLICSPTRIVMNGAVQALPGQRVSGDGSGGAVRLVSPAVSGNGLVHVDASWGGDGRIRVDLIDRSGFNLGFSPSGSVGSLMVVFPSTVPRLDIVSVAGNAIAAGTPSPLVYTLPFGSPASQSITVRATGFSGMVPITVAVTPDSGDRILVDTEINGDQPPAEATVNVDLPQNVAVRVHAWTR